MKERIVSKAREADVTRAIVTGFAAEFVEHIVSDVVVVGAGPSGLVAARELARAGRKTLLVERNNYLGGGYWIGGYLMNKITVREPAQEELQRLGVPFKQASPGLYVADGPRACSKLIASACDAGVKVLNMTTVDDLVLRHERVEGVVINWTPVGALPRQITCVDPVALETKVVIDATGHDAAVCSKLAERRLIKLAGMGAMDVVDSENGIIIATGEVFPGLIACGMSVSAIHGVPRMGPTFGAMLLSGFKAAKLAEKAIATAEALNATPELVAAK